MKTFKVYYHSQKYSAVAAPLIMYISRIIYVLIDRFGILCPHWVVPAVLRGGQAGAVSTESCISPAKRDRGFPPPIAERQRLPNVRIISTAIDSSIVLCRCEVACTFLYRKLW